MRTARSVSTIALLAGAAMLLGGCLSIQSSFTINDDGTADVEFVTLFDTEELGELAGLFGEDAAQIQDLTGEDLIAELGDGGDLCADLTTSIGGDYEVERREIDEGGEVGVGCTVRGVPIEELTTGALGEGSSLTIEQDDDGTRFPDFTSETKYLSIRQHAWTELQCVFLNLRHRLRHRPWFQMSDEDLCHMLELAQFFGQQTRAEMF